MTICCLWAIWNIQDGVQDGGHFIAETQTGPKITFNTIFTYFYKLNVVCFSSADAILFFYNNLMFQHGIQNGC